MGADQHTDWNATAASALEWWRDAGVDTLVDDEPRDWLARTPPPAVASSPAAEEPAVAPLPDTLEAFVAWRCGPEAPEAARGPGLGPEGDFASDLMIVVDCPESDALLDGAAGRLFDRMLAAIGRDRATIHLAAFTTVRPLGGRIPPEDIARLEELLRHHVMLAAPRRVLLLGQAVSRALSGTDAIGGHRNLRAVNLNGTNVEVVASLHPRFLLTKPAMKTEAWKDLQLLMGGSR